jgi:hypothetical protein
MAPRVDDPRFEAALAALAEFAQIAATLGDAPD